MLTVLLKQEEATKDMFYQHCNANIPGHHDIRYYENLSFQTHLHHDYELVLVLSGSLDVTVDTFHEVVHAPCTLLILSDQIHSYRCTGPSQVIVHVFSADVVASFHKEIRGKAGCTPVFSCPPAVRDFYLDTITKRKDFGAFSLKGCLYLMMQQYLSHVTLRERTASQTTMLPAVFAYMHTHYREHITLADAAASCGYSPHYLSRIFSEAVGMDFRRFINRLRLDHACMLLNETDLPISAIAEESGFGSIRTFNRAYAEVYHDVPHRHAPHAARVPLHASADEDVSLLGYNPDGEGRYLDIYSTERGEAEDETPAFASEPS